MNVILDIDENASVGDVIKAVFPSINVVEGYEEVHILVGRFESMPMSYDVWNSSYNHKYRVCPYCHGRGGYYGIDGADWRTCYECKGSGKV